MKKSDLMSVLDSFNNSNTFTLKKSDIREVSSKFLTEAVSQSKNNAFRLDIGELVIDRSHSKVMVNRHGNNVLVELMYPNAHGKITVKVSLPGTESKIKQVALEDEEYTINFSAFILTLIDELIVDKSEQQIKVDDSLDGLVFDNTGGGTQMAQGISGNGPVWESAGDMINQFTELVALVEAEDEEPVGDEGGDDAFNDMSDEFPSDLVGEQDGEVNTEDDFTADDFSADGGMDLGGMDLGGMDLGGIGLGAGGTGGGSDEMNVGGQGEEAESYTQFREKSDWTNESLRNMQKLVSNAASKEMKKGEGVILTSDEILNGTNGMVGDSNYDIVDKFLKAYTEIDGIDITTGLMDQIEDKLEIGDEEFDSWLQSKIGEITGSSDVDETLNNDMFNEEFTPMGGESPEAPKESDMFNDDSFNSFIDKLDEDDEDEATDKKEAELEVGGTEVNEFPNIG